MLRRPTDSSPPPPARRLAAVLGAAAVVLAACASDDQPGAAGTTSGTAATTTSAPPTTPGWTQVQAGGAAPPPRSGAVMAATPSGVLYVHGGQVDRDPLGDLWRFDGATWTAITVAGDAPAPRSEHLAMWDGQRERFVIAFGQGEGREVFDDVWAFDPAAGTWTQLARGGPAARYGSCGVVDDAGNLIITHGFQSTVRFDDTWVFDLANEQWSDITPGAGARPSARCLHSCGYDPDTGDITLFGGRTTETRYLGDTWRLRSGGWEQLDVAGPSPRVRSRGAFTTAFQVLGGKDAAGFPGDAWILGGQGWRPAPAGTPADREAPALAHADGTVYLFGGLNQAGALNDLWTLR